MQKALRNETKSPRLLRLPQVLSLIPISKSTWWSGVKSGRFPASVKLSERTTCWIEQDIFDLIDRLQQTAN